MKEQRLQKLVVWRRKLLMRVLLCKIHFPFICFCKSSSHIYTSGPLKLTIAPHAHRQAQARLQTLGITEDAAVGNEDEDRKPQKQKQKQRVNNESGDSADHQDSKLGSSLRKCSEPFQTKKVQWLDFVGKELAQVQEFESSEVGDSDEFEGTNSRGCICSIL